MQPKLNVPYQDYCDVRFFRARIYSEIGKNFQATIMQTKVDHMVTICQQTF